MNQQHIIEVLQQKISPESIQLNVSMSKHTTFRVGGLADVFVTPKTEEELKAAIRLCHEEQIPFYILGNGSNLLVDDEGFRGVVIQVYKNLSAIEVEGNTLTAYAGVLLSKLANTALEHELTGLEFAHGIPGTLGGAIMMNAGAYDGEMKQVVTNATVITLEGEVVELTKEELAFGYRTSSLQHNPAIVLKATIELEKGDKQAIQDKMKDFMGRRKDKQPLEYPSAGSTFKRPEGHFAGKLIMDSGLRGYSIGGAQVSEKHCGFVINTGEATCKEILALIEHVQKTVKEQFDVTLETEIKRLGSI